LAQAQPEGRKTVPLPHGIDVWSYLVIISRYPTKKATDRVQLLFSWNGVIQHFISSKVAKTPGPPSEQTKRIASIGLSSYFFQIIRKTTKLWIT
jgi:hypothetical protein